MVVRAEDVQREAVFSADRQYRYLLTRRFGAGRSLLFVMLNPSQADEHVDDPTIRRCMGFARREDFGQLEVANLYGFRTSDPNELMRTDDPVGPENDSFLEQAVERADLVVAAWGNHAEPARVGEIAEIFKTRSKSRVQCFGVTLKGQPKHPLYLPREAVTVKFDR